MIDLHFDMETQDPDDVLALCALATHPRVRLRSVSLFPGGWDQVGVVKHVLNRLEVKDALVCGSMHPLPKKYVSEFHYKWLGEIAPAEPLSCPEDAMVHGSNRYPEWELLTGAALTNVLRAVRKKESGHLFKEWTCQGGFAGENVMSESDGDVVLEKFKGKLTCPTYNLNGDVEAARELLVHPRMGRKRMVSKNVCHGFRCDREMFERIPAGAHAGLDLLREGMLFYFEKHPDGKALHDVLAAALLLEPRAGSWKTVVPYRLHGEWGSIPVSSEALGSVRIVTRVDVGAVFAALAE